MSRELLDEAIKSGKRRDYHTAVSLLLEVISAGDGFHEAYLYLGRAYHALGAFEQALPALQSFLDLEPNSAQGFFFMGRALISLSAYKEAIKYLRKSEKLGLKNPELESLIGFCLLKLKRPDLALPYLENALKKAPENQNIQNAFFNTLITLGIKAFHQGEHQYTKEVFSFLLNQGVGGTMLNVYMAVLEKEEGNYEKALFFYEEALQEDPGDPFLRLQRASLLNLLGNKDDATREITKLDSIIPNPKDFSWNNTGYLAAVEYFQRGEFSDAALYGVQQLKRTPKDLSLRLLIGESYRNLGSLEKAKGHFERAIEIDRNSIDAYYGLITTLWLQEDWATLKDMVQRLEKKSPGDEIARYYGILVLDKLDLPSDEILPFLESLHKDSSEDLYVSGLLAKHYIKNGDVEEATEILTELCQIDEPEEEWFDSLLEMYRETENENNLLSTYKRYFQIFEGDMDKLWEYVQLLINKEDYKEAESMLVRFLPGNQDNDLYLRSLAFVYRRREQFREAAALYRKLLIRRPDDQNLLSALVYCMDRSSQSEAAASLLEKALDYLKKPELNLILILGIQQYRAGKLNKALKSFMKGLDSGVRDPRIYEYMSKIYHEQGLKEYAKQFSNRAEQYRK
jgi:tetratricopeptide (TPR) repeat protein